MGRTDGTRVQTWNLAIIRSRYEFDTVCNRAFGNHNTQSGFKAPALRVYRWHALEGRSSVKRITTGDGRGGGSQDEEEGAQ